MKNKKISGENRNIYIFFTGAVAIGIFLRFWAMSLGHNFDFESYCIVGNLASHLRNVYASTERYNYGPVFFCIQGICYKLSWFLSSDPITTYRVMMVSVLIFTDLLISFWIAEKYSVKKAVIFFLNPISILITGYHNQFDNIAILLALLSCSFYNENEKFCRDDLYFVILFSLSLMTKHILLVFPFWLLIKKGLPAGKRILYSFVPPAIFLLSFVPFIIGDPAAFQGVLNNVFFYRSFNNAPLLYKLFDGIRLPSQYWFFVFTAILMLFALVMRGRDFVSQILVYLVVMVAFSSAIANQYLVIPVVAFCVLDDRRLKYLYFIYTGIFLVLSPDGLGQMAHIHTLGNNGFVRAVSLLWEKAPYTLAAWILVAFVLTELWDMAMNKS